MRFPRKGEGEDLHSPAVVSRKERGGLSVGSGTNRKKKGALIYPQMTTRTKSSPPGKTLPGKPPFFCVKTGDVGQNRKGIRDRSSKPY